MRSRKDKDTGKKLEETTQLLNRHSVLATDEQRLSWISDAVNLMNSYGAVRF